MNKKNIKGRNKFIANIIDSSAVSCGDCTSGHCCKNVADIDVMDIEWEILKSLINEEIYKRAERLVGIHNLTGVTTCPFLGNDNRCQVYNYRPFACASHYVVSEKELCDTVTNKNAFMYSLDKTVIFKVVNKEFPLDISNLTSNSMMEFFKRHIKEKEK